MGSKLNFESELDQQHVLRAKQIFDVFNLEKLKKKKIQIFWHIRCMFHMELNPTKIIFLVGLVDIHFTACLPHNSHTLPHRIFQLASA